MDAFRQQLQRIQEQLAGLSGTQRMLVGSLVAVMVLTLLLWSRYAAQPDRVPLLNTAVREQDLARIQTALQARGINAAYSGGTVMISPDDRLRALAAVTTENLLPSNAQNLLDDILNRMTPWDSQDKNNRMWKLYLAGHIRNALMMVDHVRDVSVSVDTTNTPRFGGSVSPTAAIWITTSTPGQSANRQMVEGVATFVSGTVAGMKKSDVKIVVDGRAYPLDGGLAGGGSGAGGAGPELLELTASYEQHYVNKVLNRLSYIPNVHVAVTVKVNAETKHTELQQIDEIKSKEAEINSETSETTQAAGALADPGFGANTSTPLAVPSTGGGGNSTTTEKTITKMQNFPSSRQERSTKPAGEATPVAATVAIPRSWFVAQLKSLDAAAQAAQANASTPPAPKEPDVAVVDAKIAAESPALQESVRLALGLDDASAVQISTYVDAGFAPGSAGPGAAFGLAAGGAGTMLFGVPVGNYVKEIIIGGLAAISLFMVSMIIRKGTPPPLVVPEPVKRPRKDAEAIDGNEPLIGIAATGNPTLDGMEVGDDDLKSQQMIDQVNSMVKENPDAAAQLVKRWLNRS